MSYLRTNQSPFSFWVSATAITKTWSAPVGLGRWKLSICSKILTVECLVTGMQWQILQVNAFWTLCTMNAAPKPPSENRTDPLLKNILIVNFKLKHALNTIYEQKHSPTTKTRAPPKIDLRFPLKSRSLFIALDSVEKGWARHACMCVVWPCTPDLWQASRCVSCCVREGGRGQVEWHRLKVKSETALTNQICCHAPLLQAPTNETLSRMW